MTPSTTTHNNQQGAHLGAVLAIILVSYLMIILDVSIVTTGLPKIRAELGFSATHLSWVQSAYTLAFGGLLLLAARAGDILGRRRMFLVGLTVWIPWYLTFSVAAGALTVVNIACCNWMQRRWDSWIRGYGAKLERRLDKLRRGRLLRYPVGWITRDSDVWLTIAAGLIGTVIVVAVAPRVTPNEKLASSPSGIAGEKRSRGPGACI